MQVKLKSNYWIFDLDSQRLNGEFKNDVDHLKQIEFIYINHLTYTCIGEILKY